VRLEQNDQWQLQHRYMQVKVMAESTPELNANSSQERPSQRGVSTSTVMPRRIYTPLTDVIIKRHFAWSESNFDAKI